jgi:hypothetical protein
MILAGRIITTVSSVLTTGLLTGLFGSAAAEIDKANVNFPRRLPLVVCCVLTIVLGIIFIIMVVSSWIKLRHLRFALVFLLALFAGAAGWLTTVFLFQQSSLTNILKLLWTSDKVDGCQRLFEGRAECCGWDALEPRCSATSDKTCLAALDDIYDSAKPYMGALAVLGFLTSLTGALLTVLDLIWKIPFPVSGYPYEPDQRDPLAMPAVDPENPGGTDLFDGYSDEDDPPVPQRQAGFEISDSSPSGQQPPAIDDSSTDSSSERGQMGRYRRGVLPT